MRQDNGHSRFADYQQRTGIGPVRDSGPLTAGAMPGGVSAGGRIAAQFFEAAHNVAGVGLKTLLQEQEEERAVRATEILSKYRSGLAQFQDDYTQKKQGKLALSAGADFAAYARQTGNKVLDGIEDGKMRRMVMKGIAGAALHFEETGLHYGSRQKAAWEQGVIAQDRGDLLRSLGENAGNHEWADHRIADHLARVAQAHPGLPIGAYEQELRSDAAHSRLAALLGQGRTADAHSLFGHIGGALVPEDRLKMEHAIRQAH